MMIHTMPALTDSANVSQPPGGIAPIADARLYRSARAPQRGRQLLAGWLGTDDPVLGDGLQVVSELVANGVVHPSPGLGREWLVLSVGRGSGFMLVAVMDPGVVGPLSKVQPEVSDPMRESGRGLGLVAAYSQTWGTYTNESGHRVVWAALAYGGRS